MKKTGRNIIAALVLLIALAFLATDALAAYSVKQIWARFSATAGEDLSTGNVVMLKDADGYAYKADANDAALRPAIGIVGKGGSSGGTVEIVVIGVLTGWSSLSEGSPGYLSETAAGVTQSAPSYSQQVGQAINATDYLFNFQNYFDSSSLAVLGTLSGASPLVFEGATANDFETTVTVTDPTADRTITLPDATGVPILAAAVPDAATAVSGAANSFVFEGATADDHETTLDVADPTADVTYRLPVAAAGTYSVMSSTLATNAPEIANSVTGTSNGLVFEGATANNFETTIAPTDPTADRTITLPDATGTVGVLCTASHDYAGGAVDWTLTAAEAACSAISVTNASGAVNALLPAATPGKLYTVINGAGGELTFKVTGQTGGTVANGKWALYTTIAADVGEVYELP